MNTNAPSFSNDIDVLVRRDGLPAARKIFESLGYETDLRIEHGRVRRMPARVSRMTEDSIYSFGQCQPYNMLVPASDLEPLAERVQALLPRAFCTLSGRLQFMMSVDLHYTLNVLADDIGTRVKPAEAVWWEKTQPVRIDEADVSTFSDQVLSWALLHRLYYADALLMQDTSIKALCSIKLLSKAGRLDVQHIHEFARRYPYLSPSLHYGLRAADQMCGLGPQGLAAPSNLRGVTAPTMNLGDCLPALLDFGFDVHFDDHDDKSVGDGRLTVRTF